MGISRSTGSCRLPFSRLLQGPTTAGCLIIGKPLHSQDGQERSEQSHKQADVEQALSDDNLVLRRAPE
jgi:hypothetical protein